MKKHNDYHRTGDTSHQRWSMDVKAWDQANIVAPAHEGDVGQGSVGVAPVSSWLMATWVVLGSPQHRGRASITLLFITATRQLCSR